MVGYCSSTKNAIPKLYNEFLLRSCTSTVTFFNLIFRSSSVMNFVGTGTGMVFVANLSDVIVRLAGVVTGARKYWSNVPATQVAVVVAD
jgi:hypothetical protein